MPRRYNMDEKSREALRRARTVDNGRFTSSGVRKKEADRERLRLVLERSLCLAEGFIFNHPDEWARHFGNDDSLLADLRRELQMIRSGQKGGPDNPVD